MKGDKSNISKGNISLNRAVSWTLGDYERVLETGTVSLKLGHAPGSPVGLLCME